VKRPLARGGVEHAAQIPGAGDFSWTAVAVIDMLRA
jgi:hypothetical protein